MWWSIDCDAVLGNFRSISRCLPGGACWFNQPLGVYVYAWDGEWNQFGYPRFNWLALYWVELSENAVNRFWIYKSYLLASCLGLLEGGCRF